MKLVQTDAIFVFPARPNQRVGAVRLNMRTPDTLFGRVALFRVDSFSARNEGCTTG